MVDNRCEDMEVYDELRAAFEGGTYIFDAISLGIFTEAHRALRKAMHEESRNLSTLDIEEFAEKALEANAALKEYGDLMFSINDSLQKAIQRSIELENGDVLDNAFHNFLKTNSIFTHKDIMKYFEDKYSEKKLLKYIGNIPLYNKTLIFSKKEIEARFIDLMHEGVIFSCASKPVLKGKKRDYSAKLERDTFISMPVVYALFAGAWNPLAVYPEIEHVAAESSKVLRELMDGEFETNQAGRILKLTFKDSRPESILGNFAGILSMYYEQLNEPKPDFIVESEDGLAFAIGQSQDEMYESVSV